MGQAKSQTVSNEAPAELAKDFVPMVLNLDRRTDRWFAFQSRARRVGLNSYQRVSAVDGKQLTLRPAEFRLLSKDISLYTTEKPKLNADRFHNWNAAECACALSHLGMWRQASRLSPDSVALILEDDVHFEPGFIAKLNQISEQLSFIRQAAEKDEKLRGQQWDVLLLGQERFDQRPEDEVQAHPLWIRLAPKFRHKVGGTFAYLLTPTGARRLLQFVETRHMQQAVDWVLLDASHDLYVACLKQCIAMARVGWDSDIQWTLATVPRPQALPKSLKKRTLPLS